MNLQMFYEYANGCKFKNNYESGSRIISIGKVMSESIHDTL